MTPTVTKSKSIFCLNYDNVVADIILAGKAAAECISDEALIHLRSYKYSAVDKSPVSKYILGPWWNAFVNILPLWLAPNMVTLLGFFFILGNIGLLAILMPDLIGPVCLLKECQKRIG